MDFESALADLFGMIRNLFGFFSHDIGIDLGSHFAFGYMGRAGFKV